MRKLHAFNTAMNALLGKLLFVTFTAMAVLVFFQVVFRYAVEMPLAWTEELARYLLIWATYLGASIAFYDGTHINATLLVDVFPVRIQAAFLLLADAACLVFLGVFVYEGFIVTRRIFQLGQFSPSLPWLPVGLVYLIIPVGCLFMGLNVLTYALRHLAAIRSGTESGTET
ncbi:MAG: TRAP transporter small permease [Desulfovibrio sp.]|jgi:TRAP-type C4-dicarboxylate transport system permease small subunit|nr:TRAP transporter small permease [Desulfovibrio sp.]